HEFARQTQRAGAEKRGILLKGTQGEGILLTFAGCAGPVGVIGNGGRACQWVTSRRRILRAPVARGIPAVVRPCLSGQADDGGTPSGPSRPQRRWPPQRSPQRAPRGRRCTTP